VIRQYEVKPVSVLVDKSSRMEEVQRLILVYVASVFALISKWVDLQNIATEVNSLETK